MPRMNPYRPQYDFNNEPSTSGALLFVGILAAIVLAAIMWAAYVPQPNVQTGGMNAPTTSQPASPAQPRVTPPPAG
jgi:hypothetical protein